MENEELIEKYSSKQAIESELNKQTNRYYRNFSLRTQELDEFDAKTKDHMLDKGLFMGLDQNMDKLEGANYQDKYDFELLKYNKAYGRRAPMRLALEKNKELTNNEQEAEETHLLLTEDSNTEEFLNRTRSLEANLKGREVLGQTSQLVIAGREYKESSEYRNSQELAKRLLDTSDNRIKQAINSQKILDSKSRPFKDTSDELPF